MENSQQLATESFSYSWLPDRQPYSTLSENSSNNDHHKDHHFNFDVPFESSSSPVHADEIFSDGHIMPVYIDRSSKKPEALRRSTTTTSSASAPSSPMLYSYNSLGKTPFFDKKTECFFLEKWRKSSKRILLKCLGLVKPLCRSRKSNRVDDLERKVCEVRSWSNSVEASPTRSSYCSNVEKIGNVDRFDFYYGLKKTKSWSSSPPQASPIVSVSRSSNASYHDESSIHEAIMHCKRSIEK